MFVKSTEFKRARSELKKKNTDTLRLRKKVKRATSGAGSGGGIAAVGGAELAQKCLSNALQGMHDDFVILEENQRQAVRRALIEQRRRYCAFVHCIKPVMVSEADYSMCSIYFIHMMAIECCEYVSFVTDLI